MSKALQKLFVQPDEDRCAVGRRVVGRPQEQKKIDVTPLTFIMTTLWPVEIFFDCSDLIMNSHDKS